MNEHEIRVQIHQLLDSHDTMLASLRSANGALQQASIAMQQAFEAHDATLVSAIEANRAALKLLNRMMDEGVQ